MYLLVLKNQRSLSDFRVIAHAKAFYLVLEVMFHILHPVARFFLLVFHALTCIPNFILEGESFVTIEDVIAGS